jgi:hypothetical protein
VWCYGATELPLPNVSASHGSYSKKPQREWNPIFSLMYLSCQLVVCPAFLEGKDVLVVVMLLLATSFPWFFELYDSQQFHGFPCFIKLAGREAW